MTQLPRSMSRSYSPKREDENLREAIDRARVRVSLSLSAEVGNAITVTLQACNRYRKPFLKAVRINFFVATTEEGPPAGTQTLSISKGTFIFNYVTNRYALVHTASDGQAVIAVSVTGAGTRWIYADVDGVPEGVLATWT